MRLTRRRLVQGLGAMPLLAACTADKNPGRTGDSAPPPPTPSPERPAEPSPWQAPGTLDRSLFPFGVQSGDATAEGVVLRVRTSLDTATLVLVQADGTGWTEVHRETLTRAEGSVQIGTTLSGLASDTAYRACFYAEDGVSRSVEGRFRTAPAASDPLRVIHFNATSCLGGNRPWPSMVATAADDADFFCLLGDTVYADGAVVLDDYRAFYDAALAEDGLQLTTASTSIICTWDDHEVDNNWSPDTTPTEQITAALEAFREALPQRVGPTGGIWRQLSWGGALDVFVLDCRGERGGGRYLSAEQMAWLKAGLRDSQAVFKIILNSVPINDYSDLFGTAFEEDRWQGYPDERDEILSFIADTPVTGVLWVSGDVHHPMVCNPDLAGTGPGGAQWEVAVGPAGSTPNVLAGMFEDTEGHYLYLDAVWNTVRFRCDPGLGEVTVTFVGDDGGVLWEGVLSL